MKLFIILALFTFNASAVVLNAAIYTNKAVGATFSSSAIQLDSSTGISISAIFSSSSSISGSISLEASNKATLPTADADFVAISSSSQAVTADGNIMYNIYPVYYKWIRLKWTHTSGSSVLNANYNLKNNNY